MILHKLICKIFKSHLWYETFRYAPQGFESTVYKVHQKCASCSVDRWIEVPYGP